jgi:hypothetical protein
MFTDWSSQNPDPGVILEQVRIADVQYVHRFVARDVPHLEHRRPSASGAREESGPERMGTEIASLKPEPTSVRATMGALVGI